MGESKQPAPAVQPRYSTRVFPPYRFIPGVTPHPRRHPEGHSIGLPEIRPGLFRHGEWAGSEDYLFAIDLYNFAYWWEAHEILEGLWHAYGRATQEGNFFQALIQLAAANLKQTMGCEDAAEKLVQRGLARLQSVPPHYMGVDTLALAHRFRRWLEAHRDSHVWILLEPAGSPPVDRSG